MSRHTMWSPSHMLCIMCRPIVIDGYRWQAWLGLDVPWAVVLGCLMFMAKYLGARSPEFSESMRNPQRVPIRPLARAPMRPRAFVPLILLTRGLSALPPERSFGRLHFRPLHCPPARQPVRTCAPLPSLAFGAFHKTRTCWSRIARVSYESAWGWLATSSAYLLRLGIAQRVPCFWETSEGAGSWGRVVAPAALAHLDA